MKIQKQPGWMVSPKSFIKLLGAEYDLMQQAGTGVLGKFYLSGITIVLIIFISFGSIRYAIDLLFHDHFAEIILSVFFALLFACIYIFLLNTLSKQYSTGVKRLFSLANTIRILFIVFMAFMVAQPMGIFSLGERLEKQTIAHKEQVLQNHLQNIHGFYQTDLQRIEQRKQYCDAQKNLYGTHGFDEELTSIQNELTSIQDKEDNMAAEARRKIDGSSFFLYRIQVGSHYIRSWLLTLFVILLFLFPGYLIYSISSDDAYYALKRQAERNMITNWYIGFTESYKEMFRLEHGVSVELYSRFDDPPFKLIRKRDIPAGDETAFLKKYISAD